jgi:hypothetical protein
MVRPDLREDMALSQKYQVFRRERERCGLHHGGPQSLMVNPVPRDERELQPSTRVFKEMRERDHSSAWEEDSLRERGP